MENLIKMDDLGVAPIFGNTPKRQVDEVDSSSRKRHRSERYPGIRDGNCHKLSREIKENTRDGLRGCILKLGKLMDY